MEGLIDKILDICQPEKQHEAKKELKELLNRYEIKKRLSETNPDITDKMNMFILSKKMEGLSPKTLKNYERTITDFGRHISKTINHVTTDDIRKWLANYSHLEMSTIRYHISVLRSFYNFLVIEELVDVDPTRKIKIPKIKQQIPKPLSIEELEIVREGCKTLRDKAILEILYATGCRLDEIYRLDRLDVNWQTRSLIVTGKGNKERIVFFNPRAGHVLKKYLDSRSDDIKPLFVTEKGIPRRLSQRSIHDVVKKIADRAEFKKNIHPHIFRHTMATTMLDHGASLEDVQAILGHSSPNTTQVYAKVSLERKKKAYDQHFVN
ncbi:MAG: integrase [Firmicutes bacterium]|nr:integrase [Bacillota bacterium]